MEKRLNIVSCRYQGDNGYTILLCDEINEGGKAIDCSLTCVGNFLPTTKNRIFIAEVEETENKKYGKQYLVHHFEMPDPTDKEGVVDVILGCKLRGIGKKKAEKIVDHFGAKNTLNVLDTEFMRVREVRGMPKNLEIPMKQWRDSRDLRQMMALIGNNVNISQNKLLKIKQHFKGEALDVMQNQPYLIMNISGIDFLTVDSIARNCGSYPFVYNDKERIKAGIKQSLIDGMVSGHLFLHTNQLIEKTQRKLMIDNVTVNEDEVKICINLLLTDKELAFTTFNKSTGDFAFYLATNYNAEQSSAEKIIELIYNGKHPIKSQQEIENEICKQETSNNIKLAKGQKNAVINALTKQVSIITGGAGRGKTTVLNMILKVYQKFFPDNSVVLMAPTGRAARRMTEATGMEAYTIHSMLGLRSDEDTDEYLQDKELGADLCIIDEMSMVDQKLFAILCSQLPKNCKLVFVGDKDQLSSVGAGNVFAELISSNTVPTTILDTPFRQDENDLVFINAEKINKGDTNVIEGVTFKFIDCNTEDDIRDTCLSLYQRFLKENNNDLDSIYMLSPFRRRTDIGSDQLNNFLQNSVNVNANKLVVNAYGKRFCKGDKVMHNKNITTDEGLTLSNGDIGYITELSAGLDNDSSVTVEYEDVGTMVYSDRDDFEMLELAYATTVHKAQGSEAKIVIIPMSNMFSIMLKRNLIYTAVSRAKQKVIIVGQRSAFNKAILNDSYDTRNTLLGWRLQMKKKEYEIPENNTYNQLSFSLGN